MSILKERHYKDDLTGKQFGELTVLEPDNSRVAHSKYWKCRCSCGKEVIVSRGHLLDGSTKSCGHLQKQSGIDHSDNLEPNVDLNRKYKTNLRVIANKKMQPNNTSGVKGVDFHKPSGLWRARVKYNGKEIARRFKNKEDAIAWRKWAEQEYYDPIVDSAIKVGDLKESDYNRLIESKEDIKKENYINEAYHYGDLDYGKKAETRNQFGTKRGTGHFGTGFYSVGKYEPEKVPSPYNTRACWEIDLDKYNLFKPESNSEAHNLHDALKYINEYVDRNSFVNYDEQKLLQELDDLEYYRDNQGIIDFIKKYDSASLDEDNNPNYTLIHDIENNKWGVVDSYARELCKDMASSSDYLNYAVDILNRIFKLDKEELKELVRDAYFNKSNDSVSTNFMKALDYEGVDVSHLDHDAEGLAGLDNFSYGSVVYDLKPNTYRKVK